MAGAGGRGSHVTIAMGHMGVYAIWHIIDTVLTP